MGVFSNNQEELALRLGTLQAQTDFLIRENEALREERTHLMKRIDTLQDALIAVKSPESYRMLSDDATVSSFPKQNTEAAKKVQNDLQDAMAAIEGPLFRGPDDFGTMMDNLNSRQLEGHDKSESLHGNDES